MLFIISSTSLGHSDDKGFPSPRHASPGKVYLEILRLLGPLGKEQPVGSRGWEEKGFSPPPTHTDPTTCWPPALSSLTMLWVVSQRGGGWLCLVLPCVWYPNDNDSSLYLIPLLETLPSKPSSSVPWAVSLPKSEEGNRGCGRTQMKDFLNQRESGHRVRPHYNSEVTDQLSLPKGSLPYL